MERKAGKYIYLTTYQALTFNRHNTAHNTGHKTAHNTVHKTAHNTTHKTIHKKTKHNHEQTKTHRKNEQNIYSYHTLPHQLNVLWTGNTNQKNGSDRIVGEHDESKA